MSCIGINHKVFAILAFVGVGAAIAVHLAFRGPNDVNADRLANVESVVAPQPIFAIEPESLDVGAIPVEGGVREVEMTIRNVSVAPIQLKVVSKSCACMDVNCPEKMAPMAADKLRLTLDPKRKPGKVTAVAVICVVNGAGEKVTQECIVKYDAIPKVALEPEIVVVDDLGSGEIAKRQVDVYVRTPRGEALSPPIARCDQAGITTLLTETTDRHDKNLPFRRVVYRYEIGVETAEGMQKDVNEIPIHFSEPTGESEILRLRILRQHHPILVGPTAILVNRDGPSPSTLKFWARNGQTFEVTKVLSSLPWLSAECVTKGENRIHELKIVSNGTPPTSAVAPGVLRIAIKGCTAEYVVSVVVRNE